MAAEARHVELSRGDVLVYRGMEVDRGVLDAIVGAAGKKKRLLWAFVKNDVGDIQAIAYSENECIWLLEEDIIQPDEVEL